jgi:hypothetical protein
VVDRLPKTRSGKILRGTMVKIADGESYKMPARRPSTIGAAVAILGRVPARPCDGGAAGDSRIAEVAVIADGSDPVPPCGGCRQKLAEFAAPEVVVTMATVDGKTLRMTVGDLLPGRFVADHMDRARPGTS